MAAAELRNIQPSITKTLETGWKVRGEEVVKTKIKLDTNSSCKKKALLPSSLHPLRTPYLVMAPITYSKQTAEAENGKLWSKDNS